MELLKHSSFIQMLKLGKNMQLGADADIYIDKE